MRDTWKNAISLSIFLPLPGLSLPSRSIHVQVLCTVPRQKKKHHARRIIRPAKAHRNKILNRDLDIAYTRYCGSRLHDVLVKLEELMEESNLAKAYYLALKTEIANRRAKKHKGDMRQKLYRQKTEYLNQLISHCTLCNYRVERDKAHDIGGPSDVLYCYLPECEQISWHCALGSLPLPQATEQWDQKKFTALKKIEAGLVKTFFPTPQ